MYIFSTCFGGIGLIGGGRSIRFGREYVGYVAPSINCVSPRHVDVNGVLCFIQQKKEHKHLQTK